MAVKSKQIAIGIGAMVVLIAGGVVVSGSSLFSRWQPLSAKLGGEPPLLLSGPSDTTQVLARLSRSTGVARSIDGVPIPVVPTQEGFVDLSLRGHDPGLHVERLRISSDTKVSSGELLWSQTISLGAMVGPFANATAWHTSAARLHVSQKFLETVAAPLLQARLPEMLSGAEDVPQIASTVATFTLGGDGVDAGARFEFANGRDLQISGHVRVFVDDDHQLRFTRVGDLTVVGTQVDAWREEGTVGGGILGGALGGAFLGPLGMLGGAVLAAVAGDDMAGQKVHDKATSAVDEQGLRTFEQMFRLPPSFEVKEGITARIRYGSAIEVSERQRLTVAFDLQTAIAKPQSVATPGPVDQDNFAPPAVEADSIGELVVDVSPGAVNGLLDAWWRSGRVTTLMNEGRWFDAVNKGQQSEKLDFELKEVVPLLPPFVAGGDGTTVVVRTAETRLNLRVKSDGHVRDARAFADVRVTPTYDDAKREFDLDAVLGEVGVTCHDTDGPHVILRPCYAELLKMVTGKELAVPNPNLHTMMALPLSHFLTKGDGTEKLPFKLTHVVPTVLGSTGQSPWVRITAAAVP